MGSDVIATVCRTAKGIADLRLQFEEILKRRLRVAVVRVADVADLKSDPNPVAVTLFGDSADELVGHAEAARRAFPNTPRFGVLTAREQIAGLPERAVLLLQDHVVCPLDADDVVMRMRRLIAHLRPAAPDLAVRDRGAMLIGQSPSFRQAQSMLESIAAIDATCLIEGETGTGKELFARSIHYLGRRKSSPFVPVNCGALPDTLLENELFGHVKGAYTDARNGCAGLLEFAQDGTLFLDEVDTLSLAAQVKLLRVLQEGEYRAVGSAVIRRTAARIVAASNANLRERIKQGSFRSDLFHRLNVLRLRIPPLRERSEDVVLLAQHFLKVYAAQHGSSARALSAAACQRLCSHPWPGNVRELQSVMQRAVLLTRTPVVDVADLDLSEDEATSGSSQGVVPSLDLASARTRCVDEFERHYLLDLLATHEGNVSHSARAAGKDRRSFQRLLKKHGIARQEFLVRQASA